MESEHLHRESLIPRPHAIGIRVDQGHLIRIHRAMLVAAMVGFFASVYLFIAYVSGKPIACGPLAGCEIVRASRWAYTFGLPRPLLGIVFYLAIVFLLSFRAYVPHYRPRWWRAAMLTASTVGIIESGFLTLVQWLDIKAFCLWCVTSAVAATVLFSLSLFDGREPTARGAIVKELKFIFAVFATTIVAGTIALYFLLGEPAGGKPKMIVPATTVTSTR
jgi:uncharacterized membrane protein